MKYLIKELCRHLWRTIAGISGYIIIAFSLLLVLSVIGKNEKDSKVPGGILLFTL
jgi:hypothetical protein